MPRASAYWPEHTATIARLRRAIIAQPSGTPNAAHHPAERVMFIPIVPADNPLAPPNAAERRPARRGTFAFAPGTAPSDPNHTRRPGPIQSPNNRPAPRLAPNRLVREYSGRPDAMPPTLKRTRGFVDTLCTTRDANDLHPQARYDIPQSC